MPRAASSRARRRRTPHGSPPERPDAVVKLVPPRSKFHRLLRAVQRTSLVRRCPPGQPYRSNPSPCRGILAGIRGPRNAGQLLFRGLDRPAPARGRRFLEPGHETLHRAADSTSSRPAGVAIQPHRFPPTVAPPAISSRPAGAPVPPSPRPVVLNIARPGRLPNGATLRRVCLPRSLLPVQLGPRPPLSFSLPGPGILQSSLSDVLLSLEAVLSLRPPSCSPFAGLRGLDPQPR